MTVINTSAVANIKTALQSGDLTTDYMAIGKISCPLCAISGCEYDDASVIGAGWPSWLIMPVYQLKYIRNAPDMSTESFFLALADIAQKDVDYNLASWDFFGLYFADRPNSPYRKARRHSRSKYFEDVMTVAYAAQYVASGGDDKPFAKPYQLVLELAHKTCSDMYGEIDAENDGIGRAADQIRFLYEFAANAAAYVSGFPVIDTDAREWATRTDLINVLNNCVK